MYNEKHLVSNFESLLETDCVDWDKFYADMIEIGKSYNQDSILVCPPGGLRDMFTLIQRERRILLMTLNILM